MATKLSGRQRAEARSDIEFLRGQAATMLRSRPRGRINAAQRGAAGGPRGLRAMGGAQEFRRIARSQGRSINAVSADFARGVRAATEGLTARQAQNLYNRSVAAGDRTEFFRDMVNIGRRRG